MPNGEHDDGYKQWSPYQVALTAVRRTDSRGTQRRRKVEKSGGSRFMIYLFILFIYLLRTFASATHN